VSATSIARSDSPVRACEAGRLADAAAREELAERGVERREEVLAAPVRAFAFAAPPGLRARVAVPARRWLRRCGRVRGSRFMIWSPPASSG
jgi:hypothetical protein